MSKKIVNQVLAEKRETLNQLHAEKNILAEKVRAALNEIEMDNLLRTLLVLKVHQGYNKKTLQLEYEIEMLMDILKQIEEEEKHESETI